MNHLLLFHTATAKVASVHAFRSHDEAFAFSEGFFAGMKHLKPAPLALVWWRGSVEATLEAVKGTVEPYMIETLRSDLQINAPSDSFNRNFA